MKNLWTHDQKRLLGHIRQAYPYMEQRKLARQVKNPEKMTRLYWANRVRDEELHLRTESSIYGALRRLDAKIAKQQLLSTVGND